MLSVSQVFDIIIKSISVAKTTYILCYIKNYLLISFSTDKITCLKYEVACGKKHYGFIACENFDTLSTCLIPGCFLFKDTQCSNLVFFPSYQGFIVKTGLNVPLEYLTLGISASYMCLSIFYLPPNTAQVLGEFFSCF